MEMTCRPESNPTAQSALLRVLWYVVLVLARPATACDPLRGAPWASADRTWSVVLANLEPHAANCLPLRPVPLTLLASLARILGGNVAAAFRASIHPSILGGCAVAVFAWKPGSPPESTAGNGTLQYAHPPSSRRNHTAHAIPPSDSPPSDPGLVSTGLAIVCPMGSRLSLAHSRSSSRPSIPDYIRCSSSPPSSHPLFYPPVLKHQPLHISRVCLQSIAVIILFSSPTAHTQHTFHHVVRP